MAILARRTTSRWLRWMFALVAAGVAGITMIPATPAAAATGGCYGASCTGLDPSGRCDGDAYTVLSIGIVVDGAQYAGQLDLRYSRSCAANWGRFTAATGLRESFMEGYGPVPLSGRVTAWNPGGPSQPTVQGNLFSMSLRGYSTWSRMVDGRGKACVGVEPYFHNTRSQFGEIISKGWFWGPCA